MAHRDRHGRSRDGNCLPDSYAANTAAGHSCGCTEGAIRIDTVTIEAEKRTKRLFMVVIILSAILVGGYIGKVMRSPSQPQPSPAPTGDPVQPPRSQ